MTWTLDKSRPICPQIGELICVAIAKGALAANERLPSVREIALEAGVNPNTVQKSLEELERRGVIHSVPCSGWYVNENRSVAAQEVNRLRTKRAEEYLLAMAQLGCDADDAAQYLKNCRGEKL